MKLPTTTFKDLYEAEACTESYRRLAKALGGLTKYGRTTPITCLPILDACGLEDLDWALEEAYMEGDLKTEQKLEAQVRKALNQAYDANDNAWELYYTELNETTGDTETDAAYYQAAKNAKVAEAKELKKQTVKLRKYLVKHGG